MLKLNYKKSIKINFKIKCITGLHIGGSKDVFDIGGIDNPVIKVPMTFKLNDGYEIKEGMPYIPGSSLKGKIRSLLDWKYQTFTVELEEKNNKKFFKSKINYDLKNSKKIGLLFGFPAEKSQSFPAGPPRLKFFDAYPTEETIEKWENSFGEGIYTEIKYENQIDRLTSLANPRPIERVPAGSEFFVKIIFDIFEVDEDNGSNFYKELFGENLKNYNAELLKIFLEGLILLENSFLGGGGTRGNGRVKLNDIKINRGNIKLENCKNLNEILNKE